MAHDETRPLSGIKVLDFSKFIAGPICTQYLGAMGADIIKVEDPDGGDGARSIPPFVGDDGATYLAMNANKRSISVNLKSQAGLDIILKMVPEVDVVVESLAPNVADRLGIGADALRAINPKLIYCSISGFGKNGPLGDQPGYEVMMQAFSGLMSVTGEPNSGPLRIAFSPLDQTTGLHALTGVLAALRQRDLTGVGSEIEVSLFETAIALLGWHAQSYWIDGVPPKRVGSGHATLVPYGSFRAQDGDVLIAIGSDNLWRKFCTAADLNAAKDDPRYAKNAGRVALADEVNRLVQDRISEKSIADWTEVFTEHRIPFAPVNDLPTVLNHPQLAAQGLVDEFKHAVGGDMRAVGHPVTFKGLSRSILKPPPLLGEHTDEVLMSLGYSKAEVEALAEQGAISSEIENK
ncbi:CoA transferase [Sneathiella chungangensis]|uniref:CoA transferase n=1 Tax=Sneathiella chungangensis TaxID=1418234 RepID=A0A845MF84_9PROT|nr:CoA transferase [Sneathiella chungangensis]MZR22703.1 CoA transferase [Sneathiella chungangensis]